jgi:hypothetical protein
MISHLSWVMTLSNFTCYSSVFWCHPVVAHRLRCNPCLLSCFSELLHFCFSVAGIRGLAFSKFQVSNRSFWPSFSNFTVASLIPDQFLTLISWVSVFSGYFKVFWLLSLPLIILTSSVWDFYSVFFFRFQLTFNCSELLLSSFVFMITADFYLTFHLDVWLTFDCSELLLSNLIGLNNPVHFYSAFIRGFQLTFNLSELLLHDFVSGLSMSVLSVLFRRLALFCLIKTSQFIISSGLLLS